MVVQVVVVLGFIALYFLFFLDNVKEWVWDAFENGLADLAVDWIVVWVERAQLLASLLELFFRFLCLLILLLTLNLALSGQLFR